jgi:D-alanyl-D-alanine carboxypeptidase (penicillin-binding protein 5/6)
MDADSGRILYEKNGFEERPMASTTKILTCILVLEHLASMQGEEKEVAVVSEYAAVQPKVCLGAQEGEKYYVKDLLYSLMLESHNDAAVVLAEYVDGSVEAFAGRMNEKAKEIGCEQSHFVTPNGLDGEDEEGIHRTTAADLAKIMRYCIQISSAKETFLAITGTAEWSFTDVEGTRYFSCTNHNTFLTMMEGALSGKTGFTGNAGYCYVGALSRDGKTFIVALLACGWPNNKNYKWSDTRKLMEYGLERYEYRSLWREVDLPDLLVRNGIPESGKLREEAYVGLEVKKEEEFSMLLKEEEMEQVSVKIRRAEVLTAPVLSGQKVGEVCYYFGEELIGTFSIQTIETVGKKDFWWYLKLFLKSTKRLAIFWEKDYNYTRQKIDAFF